MQHSPIKLEKFGIAFSDKICFEDFSTTIHYGNRIAIIGRNGTGKTTLLNMLRGAIEPSEGSIKMPKNVHIGYVPQIVEEGSHLSGGQRFNAALTEALAEDPNLLLLDEPTNHLDAKNRRSLMRMLQNCNDTLILVSHDPELLRSINTFWHIEHGVVTVFNGSYNEYRQQQSMSKEKLEAQLALLERNKKKIHSDLMREQERVKKSKAQGEKRFGGDTIALRSKQGRGETTANKNKKHIQRSKDEILHKLASIYEHEEIEPKFSITAADIGSKNVISITEGACGYTAPILSDIYLTVGSRERIALSGDNGSGKSTLLHALLQDPQVHVTGTWHISKKEDIGYLDQHYSTLDPEKTVFDHVHDVMPGAPQHEVRIYLNDFLFRKNEEIQAQAKTLSGGERARLCLAMLAAKTPKLLLLDEITNNIDLETREHVIEVLRAYPGALVAVSHDTDFLQAIGIERTYYTKGGSLITQ